jgi:hypothetical protein
MNEIIEFLKNIHVIGSCFPAATIAAGLIVLFIYYLFKKKTNKSNAQIQDMINQLADVHVKWKKCEKEKTIEMN